MPIAYLNTFGSKVVPSRTPIGMGISFSSILNLQLWPRQQAGTAVHPRNGGESVESYSKKLFTSCQLHSNIPILVGHLLVFCLQTVAQM